MTSTTPGRSSSSDGFKAFTSGHGFCRSRGCGRSPLLPEVRQPAAGRSAVLLQVWNVGRGGTRRRETVAQHLLHLGTDRCHRPRPRRVGTSCGDAVWRRRAATSGATRDGGRRRTRRAGDRNGVADRRSCSGSATAPRASAAGGNSRIVIAANGAAADTHANAASDHSVPARRARKRDQRVGSDRGPPRLHCVAARLFRGGGVRFGVKPRIRKRRLHARRVGSMQWPLTRTVARRLEESRRLSSARRRPFPPAVGHSLM